MCMSRDVCSRMLYLAGDHDQVSLYIFQPNAGEFSAAAAFSEGAPKNPLRCKLAVTLEAILSFTVQQIQQMHHCVSKTYVMHESQATCLDNRLASQDLENRGDLGTII